MRSYKNYLLAGSNSYIEICNYPSVTVKGKDHNNQLRLRRLGLECANPLPDNNITDKPDIRDETTDY